MSAGGLLGAVGGGSIVGGAVVRLLLDDRDFQAKLAAAQGKTNAAVTGIGGSFKRMSAIGQAAFIAAGVALVTFAGKAIQAASDSQEAWNKVNVTFGAAAKIVHEFAEGAAESAGMAASAAEDAAANFGQLLKNAGLTADKAAEMSVALVQLAGDMASFQNEDPSTMLQALQSALAGQTRAIKQYGVLLSETLVKQEAWTMGIAAQGQELTEAQKLQARYSLILKQTADQQGDFGRTLGESLPNQMRQLRAELDNFASDFGAIILPMATDAVKALNPLVSVLRSLAPVLVSIGKAFLVWKGLGLVASGATKAGVGILQMTKASLTAQGAVSKLGGAVGALVPAFAAAVLGGELLGKALAYLEGHAGRVESQVENASGKVIDMFLRGEVGAERFAEALGHLDTISEEAGTGLNSSTMVLEELERRFHAGEISGEDFVRVLRASGVSAQVAAGHLRRVEMASQGMTTSIRKGEKAIRGLEGAELDKWVKDTADSLNFADKAFDELAGEAKITGKEVAKAFTSQLRAQRSFTKNLESVQEKLHGAFGDAAADDIAAFTKHLVSLGPEGLKVAQAIAKNEGAAKKAFKAFQGMGNNADAGAKDLSTLGTQADRVASDANRAATEVDRLADAIRSLTNKTVTVTVNYRQTGNPGAAGGGVVPFANGGVVRSPTLLVGEGRYPTFAGRGAEGIVPFNERGIGYLAEAMRRAGGGPKVVINGDVYGFDDFERKVSRAATKAYMKAAMA